MDQQVKFIDAIFSRQRWLVHVLFWVAVLVFYVAFFGRKNSNYVHTFFFVSLLMPVTIGATYFLNYYLLPHYLMRGRYGFFFLYFVYALVGSLFLEMMIAMLTFIVMAGTNIRDMSPASIDLFFMLASLLLVIFLAGAIKLLLHWRQSKEDYQALMLEKVDAELRFLKTQLNPHFLFNTLNNLYYLAQQKSEKTPQAILALSEILDYVLHSGKVMLVPLEKELEQVTNYLALELLRYEDRVTVETNVMGDVNSCQLPPMMLITLLENAFKHGVMNNTGKTWIKLDIAAEPKALQINVSNSCSHNPHEGKGIGLQNLRNQLNLLYPSGYSLSLDNSNPAEFSVSLTLPAAL
ncbi:MAG: histidine kinase [Cyclobacteriaceae bacterium]|nr:histidine kinase [Cyclobacteriaceae bacterium]